MSTDMLKRHQQLESAQPVARPNPYQELYGLRENPFPSMALFTPAMDDPRRNGEIYDKQFRLAEERKFFELFVQRPTGDTPVQLGFVRLDPQAGGRGNGKSTFLHHLMLRINEPNWNGWETDPADPRLFALSVHLLPEPRKQKRFWQFIHLIFETLSSNDLFPKIDANLRAAMLLKLLTADQVNEAMQQPDRVSAALQSSSVYIELLKKFKLTAQSFTTEVERQLKAVAGNTLSDDFLRDFINANAELHVMWSNWKKSGIVGNAYRWRNSGVGWFLNGLVPVLMVAGYQHFYVLLDEFEKIYIYQSGREREEFLDELRQHFFERDSAAVRRQYVSTILTIHPSIDRFLKNSWARVGLDNLAPLEPSRMQYQAVELGQTKSETLAHLLITYIDYFREPKLGTLFPFADNALEPAIEAARYYPRGTLWYAHNILQKAASENMAAPITREYVSEFVESGQRPPADEEDEIFTLPSSDVDLSK